jgi:hypothetical protein
VHAVGSSSMSNIPSSSKQGFLQIPSKSSAFAESSASSSRKNSIESNQSNDSALGRSPNTSFESHPNCKSLDSGCEFLLEFTSVTRD